MGQEGFGRCFTRWRFVNQLKPQIFQHRTEQNEAIMALSLDENKKTELMKSGESSTEQIHLWGRRSYNLAIENLYCLQRKYAKVLGRRENRLFWPALASGR